MITKELKLYKPHDKQLEFHNSKARFRVCSLGRQAGKSTMAMNEILLRAWENPKTRYWFLSPIYSQAKYQFRKALHFLPPEVVKSKSETELIINLTNDSAIDYKSGEVLDRLRGASLNGVVIDEVRDQHDELWPMVIRPMLATTNGWAAFISTPDGYNSFYDLYEMSKSNSDWESFQAPSSCNPIIPGSELEAARSVLSEDQYNQEYLAMFVEIGVGKVYKQHGPHNQRTENPFAVRGYDWSFYLPILVGLDFNVTPMCWALAQHRGGSIHVVDEIAIENTDTAQCATILVEKVLHFYSLMGEGPKPHVILIGDASGNARKTSAVGETDYSIIKKALKDADIRYEDLTPKENPGIKDRVNGVNSMLKAADGTIRLTYNPKKCVYLKRDFERVKWKKGTEGAFFDKSDPLLTHMSDGLGYIVCHYNQIFRERPGRMRIISR